MSRENSGHWESVNVIERIGACGSIIVGVIVAQYAATHMVEWIGVFLVSVGVWNFFPSVRPLISSIVTRLPFLKSKEK